MFAALLIATLAGVLSTGRSGPRLSIATRLLAAGLFLYSWMPLAMLLARVVQSPYAREPPVDKDVGAIVVLAGAVHAPFPPVPFPILGANTNERCRYAAWLHREWKASPVVLSGGSPEGDSSWTFANVMKESLLRDGVPPSMLVVESRSRTTAENAQRTAEILRGMHVTKVALVTDVTHMGRAERSFEKLGVKVVPAPCGFRPAYRFELADLLPSWRAVMWNEEVVHEAVGLAWYWARGWV